VYQYVYRGWRHLPDGAGVEHVFQVSRNQAPAASVNVRLLEAETAKCEERIGRALLNPERYAIAKMTLFEAFDQAIGLPQSGDPLIPTTERMRAWLEFLGRL
jgi:hypothetical protein